jgi:hypothetical protein
MCVICHHTPDEIHESYLSISCPNIDTIPNISNIETVILENCNSVTYIPRMNRLRNLILFECDSLYRIYPLHNLTNLTLWNLPIRTIPSMPSLEILDIRSCPNMLGITGAGMPNLISLSITNCSRITLPRPEQVTTLSILELRGCNHITTIPKYEILSYLLLSSMNGIDTIPSFENLERLYIVNCFFISTLPVLPSVISIRIEGTDGFFRLPRNVSGLPLLDKLELIRLWVKEIPAYPFLINLYCERCPLLSSIRGMSILESLRLIECPLITNMPTRLNNLQYFSCDVTSPLRLYSRFYLRDDEVVNESPDEVAKQKDTMTRVVYLQNKFRWCNYTRRMRRFLSMCFSEPFCRLFWHPDGMGGQWHIRRLYRIARQLEERV